MRGLEKTRMEKGQTNRQIRKRTSRLYDRIGPVGQFNEKITETKAGTNNIKERRSIELEGKDKYKTKKIETLEQLTFK